MKIYITFGQEYVHKWGNKILDKDCVAELEAESENEAREWLFDTFDGKFFTTYKTLPNMDYFPRGVIKL